MLEPVRFNKAGFLAHFKPWIKEDGTPGDWYLVYRGQPVTWELLNEVADLGFEIDDSLRFIDGYWLLTIAQVFENYHKALRLRS